MADPALPSPASGPEAPQGFIAELMNFAGSLGRHFQTLFALAGLEGKEAAAIYLRVVAVFVAALVFAIFGYILTLLFLALLLAVVFGVNFLWISLGFAVFHLLAAALCVFYVKSNLGAPVFTATSAELKKDFESLKNLQP